MKQTIKVLVLMLLSLGIAHNADAQWGKLLNEAGKAMNKSNNGNKTSTTSDPNRKKSSYELQEEKMAQKEAQNKLLAEEKARKEEEAKPNGQVSDNDIPEQDVCDYNHRIAKTVTAESSYSDLARAYMYYAKCFEYPKDPSNKVTLDLFICEMDHARDVFKWVESIDDKKFEELKSQANRKPVKEGWPVVWSDYEVMDEFLDQFKYGRAKPFDYWQQFVNGLLYEGVPPFYNDIDGYIVGSLNKMDQCITDEGKMYYMKNLLVNREKEIVSSGQIHPTDENMHTAKVKDYLEKLPADLRAKSGIPELKSAEQLNNARFDYMVSHISEMPKISASRDVVHEKEAMEMVRGQRSDIKIKVCCIPSDASASWDIVTGNYGIKDFRKKYGFVVVEDPNHPGYNLIGSLVCVQKYINGTNLSPDVTLDMIFGINDPMYSKGIWQYVNYK